MNLRLLLVTTLATTAALAVEPVHIKAKPKTSGVAEEVKPENRATKGKTAEQLVSEIWKEVLDESKAKDVKELEKIKELQDKAESVVAEIGNNVKITGEIDKIILDDLKRLYVLSTDGRMYVNSVHDILVKKQASGRISKNDETAVKWHFEALRMSYLTRTLKGKGDLPLHPIFLAADDALREGFVKDYSTVVKNILDYQKKNGIATFDEAADRYMKERGITKEDLIAACGKGAKAG